ncbi:DUF4097 family beta strand repeat-containing protein [Goodfellowiella coeruleoviolacea]|nr:hypothetical protein [Goodfellowiella coeruleoviolacea]
MVDHPGESPDSSDAPGGPHGSGEPADTDQVVRRQSFEVEGTVEIDVALTVGRVEVRLVDEPGVHVEVRADTSAGNTWAQGLSGLLTWMNNQFGGGGADQGPAEAVRQTRVDLTGTRLRVHGPKSMPLRGVGLATVVRAPHGSHVQVRTGTADITVTGAADRLNLTTGSGEIRADRADGKAEIHAGSGAVRLGPMLSGLHARSGTGELEVSSVGGPTTLFTGSGDVWLGAVQSDVMVRTGSGDLTVADAACGRVELGTGSGDIRVGIRPGVLARVDLSSSHGQARSELPVSDVPLGEPERLWVRGRTNSGSVLVTTAAG